MKFRLGWHDEIGPQGLVSHPEKPRLKTMGALILQNLAWDNLRKRIGHRGNQLWSQDLWKQVLSSTGGDSTDDIRQLSSFQDVFGDVL